MNNEEKKPVEKFLSEEKETIIKQKRKETQLEFDFMSTMLDSGEKNV